MAAWFGWGEFRLAPCKMPRHLEEFLGLVFTNKRSKLVKIFFYKKSQGHRGSSHGKEMAFIPLPIEAVEAMASY
jgi:hypothetical protein